MPLHIFILFTWGYFGNLLSHFLFLIFSPPPLFQRSNLQVKSSLISHCSILFKSLDHLLQGNRIFLYLPLLLIFFSFFTDLIIFILFFLFICKNAIFNIH
ncbi:hypothetical protein Lalb_Chr19g0124291 [Lupinus albus]|uniref:Uncharacterized protein n=1 Tax=Lupinus albus TaxID=3870 RepID=A0A6A4NX72_LUPAL|nr:hypothetical protein Lalb_Chr19g0124291 [Lupinus albus]